MERLTNSKGRKKSMTSSAEAYKRLAAYESTGITPEQLQSLLDIKKNAKCGFASNMIIKPWERDLLDMLASW